MQDLVLDGGVLRLKPFAFKDPATGRRIPDEYCEPTEIKVEGKGKDSFISICGKRIADFFRDIWAEAASGGREKEAADTKAGHRTDSGTTEEKQGKENVGIIRSYSRLAV